MNARRVRRDAYDSQKEQCKGKKEETYMCVEHASLGGRVAWRVLSRREWRRKTRTP